MAEAVRVFLAGPIRLEVGDRTVDESALGGRQPRLAAAFLLTERSRPVPRSELAELLWPQELPRSWESALRNVVARVRSFFTGAGLEADVVRTVHGGYRIALPPGAVVDVEAAAAAVEAAERCLAEGDPDGAVTAGLAARAVSARPFLPEESGLWAESKQAELRRWYQRSLLALSRARLARGEADIAARDAAELVDAHPLLESAHQLLMQAQAAAGNRGEALRAYERCRRILVEELGVGPSPETERFYIALLSDPADEGPTAEGPGGSRPPFVSQRSEPSSEARFVGRARELEELARAWEAVKAGHRQLVVIDGEAGIGKTRLAAEAVEGKALDKALVLRGRCDDELPIPYQAFAEALDRYAVSADIDDLRRHVTWGGADLCHLVASLAQRLPDLAEGGGSPDEERSRLFEAVVAFFRSLTASRPVVLVIDDLHWANRASLLLLRHVVQSLSDAALLIIATVRDDEMDHPALNETLVRLRREPGVRRITLAGLDREAIAGLVRSDLAPSTPEEEEELVTRLAQETGGNPFFLAERLRQLAEVRGLAVSEIGVPEGVKEVVTDRFRRLSEPVQRLLRVASVLGPAFHISTMQQLVRADDEQLVDALEEATTARFLTDVPRAPGHHQFPHALLRAAVYETMGGARRARLHGQVAEVLERQEQRNPADLWRHLALSGSPTRAVIYAMEAARQALDSWDYERAADLLESALDHMVAADDSRLRALLDLGTALRGANQQERARAAYRQAAELARSLGSADGLAEAALGVFSGATHGGMTRAATDDRAPLLEEALTVVAPDSELRVRVLSALAYAHYFEPSQRERFAEEAVAAARSVGGSRALVAALAAAWASHWGAQNTEARLAIAEEMVALAAAAEDEERELSARLARLGDLVELGDRPQVDAEMDEVRALVRRVPRPRLRWRVRAWEALLALADGDFVTAEVMGAEALALRGDPTDATAVQSYGIQFASLRLIQGRPQEVIELVHAGAEAYPMVPGYRCVLALLLVESGRVDEARAEFDQLAVDDFTTIPPDGNWTTAMGALAEVCAALGDATRAGVLHQRLAPIAHKMVVLDGFGGGAVFWGSIAYLVGILEATMGRPDDAERHLVQAIDANRRFGAEPWATRAKDALASLRQEQTPLTATRCTQGDDRAGRGRG